MFFFIAFMGFGSSFFWIKIAIKDLAPFILVFYRSLCAALTLWFLVWIKKLTLPHNWTLCFKVAAIALVGGMIPNTLIAWGQLKIDSGVAGILVSLSPIFTALLSKHILPSSHDFNKLTVSVIGLFGVFFIFKHQFLLERELSLMPILSMILASFCYSLFGVLSKKKLDKLHPIVISAIAASSSTFCSLICSIMLYDSQHHYIPSTPYTIIAILWIGIITGVCSQIMMHYLVQAWGPLRLSMVTYTMPVIAVFLGFTIFGETIDIDEIIGAGLIIFSIYCANNNKLSLISSSFFKKRLTDK